MQEGAGKMGERGGFSLEERVAFLETEVRRLDRALARLSPQPVTDEAIEASSAGAMEGMPSVAESFPDRTVEAPGGEPTSWAGRFEGVSRGRGLEIPEGLRSLRSGEWWLNKVGIALLLFGVAFLFKF